MLHAAYGTCAEPVARSRPPKPPAHAPLAAADYCSVNTRSIANESGGLTQHSMLLRFVKHSQTASSAQQNTACNNKLLHYSLMLTTGVTPVPRITGWAFSADSRSPCQ